MECKIFCFYNSKDYAEILENIPDDSFFEIITNDREIAEYLEKRGNTATTLENYFSDYSENIFNIYQNSKTTIQKYQNVCRKIKYDEIEIIQGLSHYLIDDVLLFEKSKQILEKKVNIIFIFKKFAFSYFSILDHASKIGYSVDDKRNILLVKDGMGKILGSDDEYTSLERANTISKYKNSFSLYMNNVSKNNTQNKSISQIKASIKLLPVASQLISSKLKISKKRSVETILKKIESKISNLEESDYGFFLSSNRDDAIEPYDLLIRKIGTKKIVSIFTIDPITSSFLTKRNLRHLDFFEDTFFLAKALKDTEEGIRMNNKIIDISIENNLTLLHYKRLNQSILDGIYRAIATNIIMCILLKKINLRKCIIMNGPMLSKVISTLARKHHIPSLSIETVLVDNNALSSISYDADKICIYGDQGKKTLENFGFDKERIIVTGNPKYDYVKFADSRRARKILCSSLGVRSERKIIVIAMSRWHKNDEKWISELIQFGNDSKYQIIIKLHSRYKINPEMIKSEIKFINENCKGQNYKFSYDASIRDIISGSDVLISDFSNVAIEAMLLDKPVINVNFLKKELTDLQNFHEFGAALYTEDYKTLENMVREILENNEFETKRIEGKKRIIKLFNHNNDGKATDRIFEVLQEQKE